MSRRTKWIVAAAVLLAVVLAAVVYVEAKAPPRVARLLPECDAIVYVDVAPVRDATHFDRSPVVRSPSYEHFIEQTGIVAERDLDRAAFALHRMQDPSGPNGPIAFSEVVSGHFDRSRLANYLGALAAGPGGTVESFAGRTIYAIPSDGRTLRVVLLSDTLVAASNAPTPEQIHSIIEHQAGAANPFAGPSLLRARFADVPALSEAWGIGRIGLPFASGQPGPGNASSRISALGLELPLAADGMYVASLRYTGALHLRIDELAGSEAEAAQTAGALTNMAGLLRTLQQAQSKSPPTSEETAVRQMLDSIAVVQHGDRATLTATLPVDALKRLSGTLSR